MKFGAERYSNKTEDYDKYRPSFPAEIMKFLYSNNIINDNSVIADIGSGTGRFTRLLLEKGNTVYGVEQNNEMRAKAEELLSQFSNFISIAGSAEKTGLEDNCFDLITVAQAFHWFNKEKCLLEFKRIIKDNGKVFIVWDDFVGDYNDFSTEYRNVLSKYRNDKPENNGRKLSRDEMVYDFFRDNKYETLSFTHELYQNFDGIKGGALSASFTPKPDEENYDQFILELQNVFEKYQTAGKVCTAFRSMCYLGEI
ncbi:class I SAM-dependent methyltransferase [Clostridium sp. C2-6-12]|uniref:class I SAM-dependent methyltransferase n=1 Tax=Clostridium sp. C2-6-12 TaxID=2698832 RepID=UPI0013710528|nr:class I SAM-dependent methyltransferase [Clostridium sp. C2-6-12]